MERMIRGALGLEEASREDIRFLVVVFGAIVTTIQLFFMPEFNPFTPTHRVSRFDMLSSKPNGMWPPNQSLVFLEACSKVQLGLIACYLSYYAETLTCIAPLMLEA